MEPIKEQIKRKIENSNTVNGNKEYLDTVNGKTINEEIEVILERENITPEGVGKMLSEGLDDPKSERYYYLLAKDGNRAKLLEALHLTKEASQLGKIRTNKAIYFIAILRNWGLKTKFKKTKK